MSRALLVTCLTSITSLPALAQPGGTHAHNTSTSATSVGAMGILLVTRASPALHDRTLTEGYVTQPMLTLRAGRDGWPVSIRGTANLEAYTLRRGQLNAGVYGEGYVDRRHPHTLVHEAMLVASGSRGALQASLALGKGFVPFGSDDPMVRPFAAFPVNHHLSQVLERAQLIGAVSLGRLAIETATFNGDEPESPRDWPNYSRFGDSWASRATLRATPSLELSLSSARVASPEDAGGFGLDHHKLHAAVRHSRVGPAGESWALLELGRTDEYRDGRRAYRFATVLAEAAATTLSGRATVGIRVERTTRPDEQRLTNAFRSARPLLDFAILGRSRWDVITASIASRHGVGTRFSAKPFVEAQLARVKPTIEPTLFVPRDFYGSSTLATLSLGLRLHAGSHPGRVGRYGAAEGPS